MRIGIISDTHGLLRPQAVELLQGAARILHAGDIGAPEVIRELEKIAPVTAVRGNVDTGGWASAYPDRVTLELGGRRVHLLHDLKDLDLNPASQGIDLVVSGHSHQPAVRSVEGVLYLNPGSAGPRRFSLPIALATLELDEATVRPQLHQISF